MQYVTFPQSSGYYVTNLNFTSATYRRIIQDIYAMEQAEGNPYTSASRTFHLHKGFHSCNLFNGDILDKFSYLALAVNRVQELLYNHFSTQYIDFAKCPNSYLHIGEIWFNILRRGDSNVPHNHANYHVAGNFYLQTPDTQLHDADGALVFISNDNHNFYLPPTTGSREGHATIITPKVGTGILFQAHERHVVLPHFSDTDRIGLAFNAVLVQQAEVYRSLRPTPYWMPTRLWLLASPEKDRVTPGDNNKKDTLVVSLPNKREIRVQLKTTGSSLTPGQHIRICHNALKHMADTRFYPRDPRAFRTRRCLLDQHRTQSQMVRRRRVLF